MTAATSRASADPTPATALPAPGLQGRRLGHVAERVSAYVALTKPRIIELLLVTTVPSMMLAARGVPSLTLVLATLLGGALAAGAANAFNSYLDRDIDAVMSRTAARPLAVGAITPRAALVFAVTLSVVSVAFLAWAVNPLAAGLTLAAILGYVVGYTLILKRRTAQNIVWGGAAGCMPVLVGWAAVTGGLEWPAWVLFAIVFFWTPPHYWPLSLRFRADYEAAGVPMLPVVASPRQVAGQVLAYTVALVAVSLVLWPVADMSWVYAAVAVVTGAVFLAQAYQLRRRASHPEAGLGQAAMHLFHWSITYLTILFVAVAIDPLLPL